MPSGVSYIPEGILVPPFARPVYEGASLAHLGEEEGIATLVVKL